MFLMFFYKSEKNMFLNVFTCKSMFLTSMNCQVMRKTGSVAAPRMGGGGFPGYSPSKRRSNPPKIEACIYSANLNQFYKLTFQFLVHDANSECLVPRQSSQTPTDQIEQLDEGMSRRARGQQM